MSLFKVLETGTLLLITTIFSWEINANVTWFDTTPKIQAGSPCFVPKEKKGWFDNGESDIKTFLKDAYYWKQEGVAPKGFVSAFKRESFESAFAADLNDTFPFHSLGLTNVELFGEIVRMNENGEICQYDEDLKQNTFDDPREITRKVLENLVAKGLKKEKVSCEVATENRASCRGPLGNAVQLMEGSSMALQRTKSAPVSMIPEAPSLPTASNFRNHYDRKRLEYANPKNLLISSPPKGIESGVLLKLKDLLIRLKGVEGLDQSILTDFDKIVEDVKDLPKAKQFRSYLERFEDEDLDHLMGFVGDLMNEKSDRGETFKASLLLVNPELAKMAEETRGKNLTTVVDQELEKNKDAWLESFGKLSPIVLSEIKLLKADRMAMRSYSPSDYRAKNDRFNAVKTKQKNELEASLERSDSQNEIRSGVMSRRASMDGLRINQK